MIGFGIGVLMIAACAGKGTPGGIDSYRSPLLDDSVGPTGHAPVAASGGSNYCYYMKPVELKVARIGNSRGVRIPAKTLMRYRIADAVVMEERSEGILLRPPAVGAPRLSWEETAQAMAAAGDDWGEWDRTVADGLDTIPWDRPKVRRVAERPRASGRKARPR